MAAGFTTDLASETAPRTARRAGLSLRWRLALLVVASIVPLLAFSLGHEYLRYREEVATTSRQTLALARSMSLLIEEALQTRIAALQMLTVSRALEAGDLDAFRAQAEKAVALQFPNANILLLKEDGQQVMNTLLPAGTPLPIRRNLESTRQVFATGRPAVSNLFQGAATPRPVIAIDVPVKGPDGAVVYVLSLNPSLEAFADIIRDQHFPPNWATSITDRRGVIVARVPSGDQFIGHEMVSAAVDRVREGQDGVYETPSLEGTAMLAALVHAEQFGWWVAIGQPQAELTGPLFSTAMRTLGVGGALLAISLVLALFAARGIAGPIGSLRRLVASTDQDAVPQPVPTGLPEVDEVAQALCAVEEARRRSRQAEVVLRDGIDTIPEGFSIYDDEDRLVMCNGSYRRLFGDSADHVVLGARYEELLQAGVERGYYPGAEGQEEEWLLARIREHRNPGGGTELQLSDGRWVRVTKQRLSNGWIAGLRIDITERVRATEAEAALKKQVETVLGTVLNTAIDGIILIDEEGKIQFFNPACERLFGYRADEVIGQNVKMLMPPPAGDRQDQYPEERGVVGIEGMGTGQRKDGTIFPMSLSVGDTKEEGATAFVGIIHDLTEIQAMNRELEAFAYSVAHDLRAPLRHMDGFSQALLEDCGDQLDDAGKELLARIRSGSVRMGKLIDGLLNLSGMSRGALERTSVDLSAMGNRIADELHLTGLGRIVAVQIMPDMNVEADGRLMEAVLGNLLGNAWKFTAKNPDATISFGMTERDGKTVFVTRDNGVGFDMNYVDKLFTPFQRLHTTAEFEGTGIGLATVARIVHRHGGKIWIDSAVDEGTAVYFTI